MTKSSPSLVLLLAVLFASCGSILVRLTDAPPLAISFYRVAMASLMLLPFAARDARRSWRDATLRQHLLVVTAGVALALHFATWIASLSYTSIAASVLLVNTAPIFALLLSHFFLGERAPLPVLLAIPVASIGAAMIALGDQDASGHTVLGNLLALVGGFMLGAYHVVGRGLREAFPLNAYILGVWGAAAGTLGVLAVTFGVPLDGYGTRVWLGFFALALVPTLGGHGLQNLALRLFPAATVGLFLLGEPVGASILAFFIFGEIPGPWTLAGGVIVLGALAYVLTRPSPGSRQSTGSS